MHEGLSVTKHTLPNSIQPKRAKTYIIFFKNIPPLLLIVELSTLSNLIHHILHALQSLFGRLSTMIYINVVIPVPHKTGEYSSGSDDLIELKQYPNRSMCKKIITCSKALKLKQKTSPIQKYQLYPKDKNALMQSHTFWKEMSLCCNLPCTYQNRC